MALVFHFSIYLVLITVFAELGLELGDLRMLVKFSTILNPFTSVLNIEKYFFS